MKPVDNILANSGYSQPGIAMICHYMNSYDSYEVGMLTCNHLQTLLMLAVYLHPSNWNDTNAHWQKIQEHQCSPSSTVLSSKRMGGSRGNFSWVERFALSADSFFAFGKPPRKWQVVTKISWFHCLQTLTSGANQSRYAQIPGHPPQVPPSNGHMYPNMAVREQSARPTSNLG